MKFMAFHAPAVALACMLAVHLVPPAARADDASRISFLESEIQKLRTQLGEQDRRIQRLEAELSRRGAVDTPDQVTGRRAAQTSSGSAAASGSRPWRAPPAWERVAKGMTQDEVVKVLGEPTAIQAVDNYKTLFYKGVAADGRAVDGLVNFRDERVVAVKKPQ
jgi:hypothetical protein